MTPTKRTKARAFAIWRYANPRDWNVTYEEIAEATGLTEAIVDHTISAMQWRGKSLYGQKEYGRRQKNSRNANASVGVNRYEEHSDLTQIFRNTRLTSAQEFGIDWS